jgi:hypothetical protein
MKEGVIGRVCNAHETINAYKIFVEKPEDKTPLRRHRKRA